MATSSSTSGLAAASAGLQNDKEIAGLEFPVDDVRPRVAGTQLRVYEDIVIGAPSTIFGDALGKRRIVWRMFVADEDLAARPVRIDPRRRFANRPLREQ